jgi:plastocyanin
VHRAVTPVAAVALLLAGPLSLRPARPRTIDIRNFAFAPAADTARVGHAITFRNLDLVPHSATADGGGFESGSIAAGGDWRFVPRRKGVVTYHCRFHPTMHGTLVIR